MGTGSSQNTILYWASMRGDLSAVQSCLDNGADVDWRDLTLQRTPLHWASRNGRVDVVKMLVKHGANVNASDAKRKETPLHMAAEHGHDLVVQILLENGANVDAMDEEGHTPLHKASEKGRIAVVKVLLENGAYVDQMQEEGQKPLHLASATGHVATVKMLLDNGADVNATERYGQTPLHWACDDGHKDVVKVLVEHGADVNATDEGLHYGQTPLHWASEKGHIEVVEILLAAGANLLAIDQEGKTPRDLAAAMNHTTVVDLLGQAAHSAPAQLNDTLQIASSKSPPLAPERPWSFTEAPPCQLPVVWTLSILTDEAPLPRGPTLRRHDCRIGVVNTLSEECRFDEAHCVTVPAESEVVALVLPFVRASGVLLKVLHTLKADKLNISSLKCALPDADRIEATVHALESIHGATAVLPGETLLREINLQLSSGDLSTQDAEEIYRRVEVGVVEYGQNPDTIDRVTNILDSLARLQKDKTQAIVGGVVKTDQGSWKCHRHGSSPNTPQPHAS